MIENYFSLPLFIEVNEKYDLFYDETEKAISETRREGWGNDKFISKLVNGQIPNFLEHFNLHLKRYIEHCASSYVFQTKWSFIKPDTDYEAVVEESWVNIDGKGSYQQAHVHPQGIISGIYYHQCDGDEGDVVFYNPIPYIQYGQFPENVYTCGGELPIPLQKGKLLLFPSWLQHRTNCNQTDKERISLAFNISVKEK
tara:strand:+ start:229 stop:822 length:594 start_codon:yes stop_codon:yes gene_type:complete